MEEQVEFVVPLHVPDLTLSFDDRFCVKDAIDLSELAQTERNEVAQSEFIWSLILFEVSQNYHSCYHCFKERAAITSLE